MMDSKPECKESNRVVGAEALERLVARLGDTRFAGSDFLWILLLTYRYFTTAEELVTALVHTYREQQEEADASSDDDTLFHFPCDDDTDSLSLCAVPSSCSLSSSIGSVSDLRAPIAGSSSPRSMSESVACNDDFSGMSPCESKTSIVSKFRQRRSGGHAGMFNTEKSNLHRVSDQMGGSLTQLGVPSMSKHGSRVKHFFTFKTRKSSSTADPGANEQADDNVSIASSTSSCGMAGRCSTLTLRVFNILKQWMRNFPEDFVAYPALRDLVKDFLSDVVANSPGHDAAVAKQLLRSPVLDRKTPNRAHVIPSLEIKLESSLEFDSLSARALAETMSFGAQKHFCKIKASEFARRAWKRSNRDIIAPNVVAAINRCNWISRWVATEIVSGETVADRSELIEKFIRLATFCFELNNFNDTLLIVYSLQSSAIKRLEKSWGLLPEKVFKMFLVVEELADPAERCVAMRDALYSANPPCVPYVGAFLDLIYSQDVGQATFTAQGLINYSKLSKIGEVVRGLLLFQQESYPFSEQENVRSYLQNVQVLSEDDVYTQSVAKEPKSCAAEVCPKSP